jgi:hypothetical protein
MAEMAKEVAAVTDAKAPLLPLRQPPGVPPMPVAAAVEIPLPGAPAGNAQPAKPPPLPESVPSVVAANVPASVRLTELAGSMALSAVLVVLLCIVWAAMLRPDPVAKMGPYFFLALASTWAVLVPAKLWTKRVEDSWQRRVVMMCLGVGIGALAFWLEGHELCLVPTPPPAPVEAVGTGGEPSPDPATGRHWYTGGLLAPGQDTPAAACYLAYFGLTFFLLRWWKMADRRRSHRFSFYSILMPALCGGVLAQFFWVAQDAKMPTMLVDRATVIVVPVMAAVVIQLVSPWEAPPPRKSRKLRLANA